ncbi:MAG: FtsW/RodA/SpoVE family cell cycle protein, partial [Candidatus Cloacimonetes bacterium]|nr:FtsW/RodA/SpoVE family cell cycle protein [Candidatus Cloacimonadota bacterium]
PMFIMFMLLLIGLMYWKRLSLVIITLVVVLNVFVYMLTPVLWNSLHTYQQNRIMTFIDPARDPLGAGYQIIQAKIAIGSGGCCGKGFLEGTQKNLDFLPERHTDFIFSVIGEEFGFIGGMVLLFVYYLFFRRIAQIMQSLEIKEHRYATAGILGFLAFQVFVNIGMNLGLLPTTGIPLPFISYGGSSLLINSIAVGLVLVFLKEKNFIS